MRAAIILLLIAPFLVIASMAGFGAVLENKPAWGISLVVMLVIILFAGLTTWP